MILTAAFYYCFFQRARLILLFYQIFFFSALRWFFNPEALKKKFNHQPRPKQKPIWNWISRYFGDKLGESGKRKRKGGGHHIFRGCGPLLPLLTGTGKVGWEKERQRGTGCIFLDLHKEMWICSLTRRIGLPTLAFTPAFTNHHHYHHHWGREGRGKGATLFFFGWNNQKKKKPRAILKNPLVHGIFMAFFILLEEYFSSNPPLSPNV